MAINYGVIVGRFQVNELHAGHIALMNAVQAAHPRVICFIGESRTCRTRRNPLDFETRKKMIQADFPDFTILPLRDEESDAIWSKKLDNAIAEVTNFTSNVTLYGGRDSFVPHYHGRHQVKQLDLGGPVCGTEIRADISNRVKMSPDFRAGVIYSAYNKYPSPQPTVDIAMIYDHGDHTNKKSLLVASKPGETRFRFVGGFVDVNETLERAAQREAYEETNLDVHSLRYVRSFVVDDWRYRNDPDAKIITAFFVGNVTSQAAKACDDIERVHWLDLSELLTCANPESFFIPTHQPLAVELFKFNLARTA